jgi:hypothetical protein
VKRPALLSATALLILAIWEIAILLHARAAAPTDDDWAAVRAAVDAAWKPGDLIVFAPAWIDPVGRQHLGDRMTLDDVVRMDDARYGRVWEVSARGQTAPEARGEVRRDERHGALRVRLLERPAARVVWDLRDRSSLNEVDYAGRLCTVLRAPGRLDAGIVPLGRRLAVRAGLTDFRARRDNRAFALLRVLVDGKPVAEASIGSESGWVPLEADTTPGKARVELVADVDASRGGTPAILNLCIAAEARDP